MSHRESVCGALGLLARATRGLPQFGFPRGRVIEKVGLRLGDSTVREVE
jgi:hypothetical protein